MEFSRITYQFLFILPIAVAVVELSDFYPYGSSNGDIVMRRIDDGSSGIINIAFPFFDQNHNSLYVSSDFNELILIHCSSNFANSNCIGSSSNCKRQDYR